MKHEEFSKIEGWRSLPVLLAHQRTNLNLRQMQRVCTWALMHCAFIISLAHNMMRLVDDHGVDKAVHVTHNAQALVTEILERSIWRKKFPTSGSGH